MTSTPRSLSLPTAVGLTVALFFPVLMMWGKDFLPTENRRLYWELLMWGKAVLIILIVVLWEKESLQSIGFKSITLKTLKWAGIFLVSLIVAFIAVNILA